MNMSPGAWNRPGSVHSDPGGGCQAEIVSDLVSYFRQIQPDR